MLKYPLYWYNNLKGYLDTRGLKPSPLDLFMLYGRLIIALIYVYNVFFFAPDQGNIDEVIR